MKLKIFLIVSIFVVLAGCENYLDREPLGQQSYSDYLSSSDPVILTQNIESIMLGAYAVFNFVEGQVTGVSHHGEYWTGDLLSDDAEKGGDGASDYGSINEWRKWVANPIGGPQSSAWIVANQGVKRANDIIKAAVEGRSVITKSDYNRFIAEAKFIRGYYNFYFVKLFGQVPFIDTSDVDLTNCLAPQDMYQKIVDDLTASLKVIPTKNEWLATYGISPNGRATKAAVEMVLAKVYSMEIGFGYNGRTWNDVYALTDDIIKSGQYGLVTNYASIFELDNEFSGESIFEIDAVNYGQAYGGPKMNNAVIFTMPRGAAGDNAGKAFFSGWGFDIPSKDLFNEFESGDPRLKNTIIQSGDILYDDGNLATNEAVHIRGGANIQCPTGFFNRKNCVPLAKAPLNNNSVDKNIYLIRYAEVLLLQAEAAFNTGKENEARELVNLIRERARLSSDPRGSQLGNSGYPLAVGGSILPDVTASGADLLKAIKHERRVELALEGSRYWDLLRWGEYEAAIRKFVPADYWLKSTDAELIVANYKSHMVDGKVPVLPIPKSDVDALGICKSPGYSY